MKNCLGFSLASVGRQCVKYAKASELSLVKQQLCKTYSQNIRFLFPTDDEVLIRLQEENADLSPRSKYILKELALSPSAKY